MVALLLTAVAIMPVFGATTGAVSVSKTFVSPTGAATITVDDADLNVLITASQTVTYAITTAGSSRFFSLEDTDGDSGASGFGNTSVGDEISGTPTIPTGGVTNGTDDVDKSNFVVSVFNKKTGSVSLSSDFTTTAASTIVLDYKLATINTTSVDVSSPSSGSTAVKVILAESGADTGKFEGRFRVHTANVDVAGTVAANAAIASLDSVLAVAGQDVTIKYTDASPAIAVQTTLRVEDTSPVGALVSPADGSYTTSLAPKLTVQFTDVDSGVDNGTFTFNITAATIALDASVTGSITQGTPTITAITNGYKAEVTLTIATAQADKTIGIRWNATVTDAAGNSGQTDADASTSGSQDFALVVDQAGPDFAGAAVYAGTWWDAADSSVETKVSKSVDTIIGISLPKALDIGGTAFDLKENLNASSVTTADFEVDGLKGASGITLSDVTPSAVNVYSGETDWIFLTVPAMAPDAKPTVLLLSTSGGISDGAGNSTTTGTVVGLDKQGPTITATLSRSLDDKDATLTITTDEAGAVPTVTVVSATETSIIPVIQTVVLIGTNLYESKITPGFGLHSVKVEVTDTSTNLSTLGVGTPTADWPDSGAIVLYIDDNLPAPTVTTNNTAIGSASVELSVPFFITADYTTEGAEYGLDSLGYPTLTAASVDTNLDIQSTVTIATATLDGASILSVKDSQDNVTFNFAILDITTGEHELVIIGKDQAGNLYDTGKVKFTVTARKAYKVAMSAGWNLVSLPGAPADGAIDTVLPSSHPATDVLSFDGGVWSVAHRSAGGTWEGTLTSIDGTHGYWVNTTSSQPVAALLALPSVGSAATLPTIAIEQGWNLVSVIDLAQTKQGGAGATQTGATYFTSITWSVGYTYSSSTRTWTRVTPSSGNVINGQGVWVWATKAGGTLIP